VKKQADSIKAFIIKKTPAHSSDRTEIVVELSRFCEETLISRSQAKRIIRGLEKFNYIILDFKGVRLVGQGFVDEMFRVFAKKHPNVNICYINANDDVVFMVERGLETFTK